MSTILCTIPGCNKKSIARGLCPKHYDRWLVHGDPLYVSINKDGHKKNNPVLYHSWIGMKGRCYNKNDKAYRNYGGRGIKVCDRWLGKEGFNNFLNDMGEKPSSKHSLDRIDTNGDYCPENCRWATWEQQENNRRINVFYEYNGKKLTLPQWSKEIGISYYTLLGRRKRGLMPPELFSKTM